MRTEPNHYGSNDQNNVAQNPAEQIPVLSNSMFPLIYWPQQKNEKHCWVPLAKFVRLNRPRQRKEEKFASLIDQKGLPEFVEFIYILGPESRQMVRRLFLCSYYPQIICAKQFINISCFFPLKFSRMELMD